MATIPTNFMPVRDTLKSKYGITDDRIGYEQTANGNYVTIDNQRIFKDPTNVGGTTYVAPDVFGSAAGKINTLNDTYKLQQQVLNPAQVANPYDAQVNDTLNTILQRIQNPTPINPYASPEYAAARAQVQQGAQQATRQAQEVLGDSGFSQSTRLADRAQGIQNDANQYLETQLVPGITQLLQGREDQQIGNLMNVLGLLRDQQSLADSRANTNYDRAASVLNFLTGRSDRTEDLQREDTRLADEKAYRAMRDAIADERYKKEFDEDVRRFGLQKAAEKAYRNRQLDLEQARLDLSKDQFEFDKSRVTNDQMNQEKQGLSDALRRGELTPVDAIKQIDQDVQLGFYSSDQAAQLKKVIQTIAPSLPQPQLTEDQASELQKSLPSDKEIEAEARQLGYPTLDYRSWYKSPNGRSAGLSFVDWQDIYGPKITG